MTMSSLCKAFLISINIIVVLYSCSERDKLEIEKSAAAFDIRQGEASIKRSNQNFMKAFEAGDSVAASNCYTTNAKAMIPNSPAIEGRNDIKHFISLQMKKGVRDFELNTTKIWGDITILTEEGTYQFSDSSGNQLDKGNYIVLWKMEAGNWKMYRDIRTSELPLPIEGDKNRPLDGNKKKIPAKK